MVLSRSEPLPTRKNDYQSLPFGRHSNWKLLGLFRAGLSRRVTYTEDLQTIIRMVNGSGRQSFCLVPLIEFCPGSRWLLPALEFRTRRLRQNPFGPHGRAVEGAGVVSLNTK